MKQLMIFLAALALLVGCSAAASVTVGGYVFSTDKEGWIVPEGFAPEHFTITDSDALNSNNDLRAGWSGEEGTAFAFLAYPNAPKDNDLYGVTTGIVHIYVAKIPQELRDDIEQLDIAKYGSVDQIPDDRKAEEEQYILLQAAFLSSIVLDGSDSDKEITYNDLPARLIETDNSEQDGTDLSYGTVAVLLDQDTVGVLEVFTRGARGDEVAFDGRAWDFIDSVTIAKA